MDDFLILICDINNLYWYVNRNGRFNKILRINCFVFESFKGN